MQTTQLPDAQFEKLKQQVAASGYEDAAAYVAVLANEATFDSRCGLDERQLRESAAERDCFFDTALANAIMKP